jgi:uncharacterized delta-60 repeat protein
MKRKLLLIILSVFLGYNFTYSQPGSLDLSFNVGSGANSTVYATAIQNDGKIILGGGFTEYNGATRNCIVRLNENGSMDNSFNVGSGTSSVVNAIAIQEDGKIIIGGWFNSYNGTSRNRIARLNTNGTIDLSFDPGTGASGDIYSVLIQSDGKILIAGNLNFFNGTARNKIARLNADGSLDVSFTPGTGANYPIRTLDIQNDGKIIIGGGFTTFNGIPKNYIARLNEDGSLDATFDPGTGASNTVNSVNIQSDGRIIVCGDFTSFDGISNNRILRLNNDGTQDMSFVTGTGTNGYIYTSAIQTDGKILIGGLFTQLNSISRNKIARLNTDGSVDASFNPGEGTDNIVTVVAIQNDGRMIIGGFFTNYDGININRIARLNNSSVGINAIQGDKIFKIYPNPTKGTITIDVDSEEIINSIVLYNIEGELVGVFPFGSKVIDLSSIARGYYFLSVETEDNIIIEKVIVE